MMAYYYDETTNRPMIDQLCPEFLRDLGAFQLIPQEKPSIEDLEQAELTGKTYVIVSGLFYRLVDDPKAPK